MGTSSKKRLTEIFLQGSPFEIGEQHGRLLKEDISSFLNDNLAQINLLRHTPLKGPLRDIVEPYKEAISLYCPDIMRELEGLSKGAGITIDQAVLLQIRRELIGVGGFTLSGDCSSFSQYTTDGPIMGQTIDLNGNMTHLGNVFRIRPQNSQLPEILMYSFSGLLGYMGMNSSGLSVTINLVVSEGWTPGIPPYLIARAFLGCRSIEECLLLLETIPRASSRSFIISDYRRQVIVEFTTSMVRVIEGKFLAHSNHYLHPELQQFDRMNIFSRNSSIKRLALLEKSLNNDGITLAAVSDVFADHSLYPVGVCAHNESNIHLNETVASVIMYPLKGVLWALKGKPCECNYQQFKL